MLNNGFIIKKTPKFTFQKSVQNQSTCSTMLDNYGTKFSWQYFVNIPA